MARWYEELASGLMSGLGTSLETKWKREDEEKKLKEQREYDEGQNLLKQQREANIAEQEREGFRQSMEEAGHIEKGGMKSATLPYMQAVLKHKQTLQEKAMPTPLDPKDIAQKGYYEAGAAKARTEAESTRMKQQAWKSPAAYRERAQEALDTFISGRRATGGTMVSKGYSKAVQDAADLNAQEKDFSFSVSPDGEVRVIPEGEDLDFWTGPQLSSQHAEAMARERGGTAEQEQLPGGDILRNVLGYMQNLLYGGTPGR